MMGAWLADRERDLFLKVIVTHGVIIFPPRLMYVVVLIDRQKAGSNRDPNLVDLNRQGVINEQEIQYEVFHSVSLQQASRDSDNCASVIASPSKNQRSSFICWNMLTASLSLRWELDPIASHACLNTKKHHPTICNHASQVSSACITATEY